MIDLDQFFMNQALKLAREAFEKDEVPVGAVVVFEDKIVGKGRDRMNELHDPTCHAEIEAISAAASSLGRTRLNGVKLYVTLEPCIMCTGAIVLARIDELFYATSDPKTGACGSVFRLHDEPSLNHQFIARQGPCEQESSELLKSYFAMKRATRKNNQGI